MTSEDTTSFRRYLVTFALIVVGGVALVGGFCYWVDPFGIFGMNSVGIYSSADRESKAQFYGRGDYDAVLLGNSKAAMIPASEIDGHTFFSATFGGAMPEELFYFADRHLEEGELAIVLFDIWSYGTEAPIKEDPFATRGVQEYLDRLFSLHAFDESVKTLRRHYKGEQPAFAPDGSFIAQRWIETKDAPNAALYKAELNAHERWFNEFELSDERLRMIDRLARALKAQGYHPVAVIAPMHVESLKRLEGTPAQEAMDLWKQEINRAFPEVIDLMDSKYSTPENYFPADPTHFRPETGVSMINDEVMSVERY
ncbi:MAG: hypothetical protein AAFX93_02925 [Verrucomicrobiota bacterium]